MASELPSQIREFLHLHFTSVEQLDVLHLLWKDSNRSWSPEEINREIRSSLSSIEKRLHELLTAGFLSLGPGPSKVYQYQPQTAGLEQQWLELATLYAERRPSIMHAIFDKQASRKRLNTDKGDVL